MTDNDQIEPLIPDQRPGWQRSAMSVFRFVSYAVAVALILMASLVVFVQTPAGRSIITTQVLKYANSQINGTITCDDIRIDVFHGIVMINPRLYVDGTDLLRAEELRVSYDIASLIGHTTAINSVSIVTPIVSLIRNEGGHWNVDKLLKTSDTSTSATPKLVLRIRDVAISSGSINVIDRTKLRGDGSTFDPSYLALRNVDMRMGLLLDLGQRDYTLVLRSLALRDELMKQLVVNHASAAVRLTPNGLTLRALVLEMPNTTLIAHGQVQGADIERHGFGSAVLAQHPFRGHLESDKFLGSDIRFFLPFLDITDSYSMSGDLEYAGTRVVVTDIDLHGGPVHVQGSVEVAGLDGSSPLFLDVQLHDSRAAYSEVQRRLRFIGLPSLPFLGTTHMKHLHMKGRPADSLMFDFDGNDIVGEIRGTMALHLDSSPMAYSLHADVRRGDLSTFARSFSACNLNGRVDIVGQGFTLSDLKGAYSIKLDPSTIADRQIRNGRFTCRAFGDGITIIDTLEVDATPYTADEHDDIMETRSRQTFAASGRLDVSTDTLVYDLTSRFSSLDLQRLLQNPSLPTLITGSAAVKARGVTLDDFLGSIDASIKEFSLEDRALLPFTFHVSSMLDQDIRTVDVVAPFARARIAGRYTPSRLITTFSDVATLLSTTAMRRASPFTDSMTRNIAYPVTRPAAIDATFDIELSDASPFNVFLKNTTFSTQSTFRGKIESDPHLLRVTADELNITDLFVQADSVTIAADPCKARGVIEYAVLDSVPVVNRIDFEASCPNNIFVNKNVFHAMQLRLGGTDSSLYSFASCTANGIFGLIGMTSRYRNGQVTLSIDTLAATIDAAKKLEWVSLDHATVHARNQMFDVSGLALRRKDGETINIDGVVSFDKFSNLRVRATDFFLPDVRRFVDLDDGHPISFLSGRMREVDLSINGTWDSPVASMKLRADDVEYNKELIGSMNVSLNYAERDIKGKMSISNPKIPNAQNTLYIDVRHLPFDLGLRNVKHRIVENGVIDIDLTATQLALAAVEPFLPAVERVQGVANGMVTVRGTLPNNLELGGSATFRNGTFLTSPTNIQYRAEGSLHLEGSKLFLDTIKVRNMDRDRRGGAALASGIVTFDGLSVSRVDFSVTSKGILIMNKGSQIRNPKVFGDIVVASGSKPILFYGPLDAPVLAGDVDVLYADIIFPQNRASSKAKYSEFEYRRSQDGKVPQRSVLDTSTVTRVTSASAEELRYKTVEAVTNVIKTTTASFSDILRFNLNIYLRGRTLMTMVFDWLEILIADLEPVDVTKPLTITGRFVDNTTNMSGKVRVKEGTSTYKFYKPFSASGTLDFTQGGLWNPTLDLKAVYNGRRMNTQNNEPETYRVDIDITGTKQRPIARWSYYRNQRKQEGDSAKITGDALMMLLVGRTQDELTSSGQGNLVNELNASLSAMATSALGDLLSGVGGLVQTVQMDLGADMSQTRLTVSGQLWSDVVYRLTGQVSDFAGNSTLTVTVPFTVLNNADAMRYFMLDISRSVNNTGNITRFQRLWEIKLGARLP